MKRRSLGEKLGAKKPAASGAPERGPGLLPSLGLWAGIALLVTAAVLAVPEWGARQPDPLWLSLAGISAAAGVGGVTYYFVKAGSL
jgi:hypothetical protein